MPVNWLFIGEQEGAGICDGYVPVANTSESGVTIATGVDLGQMSAAGLSALAISEELKDKLRPYCGLRKASAVECLAARPLRITRDECTELDRAIQAGHLAEIAAAYNAAHPAKPFEQLPERAQTVIASVAFQYGSLRVRCPRFWSASVRQNWRDVIGELENFGDAYGPRRRREAEYLRAVLDA